MSAWLISRAAEHPPLVALSVAIVAVRALGISRGVFRYLERLVSHDVALAAAVRTCASSSTGGWPSPTGPPIAGLRRGDLVARLGADVELVGDVLVRGVQPFAVAGVVVLAAVLVVLARCRPGMLLAGCLLLALVVAPALAGLASARAHRVADEWAGELTGQAHDLLDHGDELAVSGQLTDRLAAAARAERGEPGRWTRRPGRPPGRRPELAVLRCGGRHRAGRRRRRRAGRRPRAGVAGRRGAGAAGAADVVAPLPAAASVLVRGGLAAQRLQPLLRARRRRPGRRRGPGAGGRVGGPGRAVRLARPARVAAGLDLEVGPASWSW